MLRPPRSLAGAISELFSVVHCIRGCSESDEPFRTIFAVHTQAPRPYKHLYRSPCIPVVHFQNRRTWMAKPTPKPRITRPMYSIASCSAAVSSTVPAGSAWQHVSVLLHEGVWIWAEATLTIFLIIGAWIQDRMKSILRTAHRSCTWRRSGSWRSCALYVQCDPSCG